VKTTGASGADADDAEKERNDDDDEELTLDDDEEEKDDAEEEEELTLDDDDDAQTQYVPLVTKPALHLKMMQSASQSPLQPEQQPLHVLQQHLRLQPPHQQRLQQPRQCVLHPQPHAAQSVLQLLEQVVRSTQRTPCSLSDAALAVL